MMVQIIEKGAAMMNILVLVKQVPDTLEAAFDSETGLLLRQDMPMAMNPFDQCVLEAAARMKDTDSMVHVTAISMGPESAVSILREALAVVADEAVLISAPAFAGADTVRTAHILTNAVLKLEKEQGRSFDLILCGLRSTDGGTSAIGPMLSALLQRPCIPHTLSCSLSGRDVRYIQETEAGEIEDSCSLPCILTVGKSGDYMRYPLISRIIKAQEKTIRRMTGNDLPLQDQAVFNNSGKVMLLSMKYQPVRKKRKMIKGRLPEEAAAAIYAVLKERHVL